MSWQMIVAIPLAYVLVGAVIARRYAVKYVGWLERERQSTRPRQPDLSAVPCCRNDCWQHKDARVRASLVMPGSYGWCVKDSRDWAAFTALIVGLTWGARVIVVLLVVTARGSWKAFTEGLCRPPREERRRKALAAAREHVARLEAELGIVEPDNQDEPDKGRREVLASNGAYARPYMTPREYADHLLSKPFLD